MLIKGSWQIGENIMEMFIIIYNIILTAYISLAIGSALSLRFYTHKKVFLAICVVLALYLADNAIITCTENIAEFAAQYDRVFVTTPSVKTVLYIVIMSCILYLVNLLTKPKTVYPLMAVLICYAFALILIPMIQQSNWMVFAYYLTNQATLIGITAWLLLKRKEIEQRCAQEPYLPPYKMLLALFIFTLCVCIAIIIEDIVVIFYYDTYNASTIKINNRNFSENLLYIGFATFLLRYAFSIFNMEPLKSDEFAQDDIVTASPQEILPPTEGEEKLRAFSIAYGLTERERQILAELLDGKGQQEICEHLVIAVGTVKTHIHNIYQKLEISKKGELWIKFQQYEER